MATTNPQIYYEDDLLHGNYQHIPLEDLVNNFQANYTGDDTILGNVPRKRILSWMKSGIKEFSYNTLNELKVVELELNDNLDIIMPPDYVGFKRASWLNTDTGEFYPMAENRNKNTTAVSFLQDESANILFDEEGFILEGTSATELVNNELGEGTITCYTPACCDEHGQVWGLDTGRNYNGSFDIAKRGGRIHFSSDNLTRIIVLEYFSDGLEFTDEGDIKVHKLAEDALYKYVNYNILSNKIGVPDYEKRRAKNEADTARRNAKLRLAGWRIAETTQMLKQRSKYVK